MFSLKIVVSMILLAASSFAQSTAHSETPVLSCSTSGFGLALMTVEETAPNKGTIKITFSEEGEEIPTEYKIKSGYLDLLSSTSATLVASKSGEDAQGGSYESAALLRVIEGKKRAYLAVEGNVHLLICR